MVGELDILSIVSERLGAARIDFMLTGSYAMAYYATPRMTRDLDIVVALGEAQVDALVRLFSPDFYIDAEAARSATKTERLFNLMHLASGIKVDFIVRKSAAYRLVEFDRRRRVALSGVDTWIATPEDLILSKLVWARDSGSELQRRDVRALLRVAPLDHDYMRLWAQRLGVADSLEDLAP
jgi:hypothetical protein